MLLALGPPRFPTEGLLLGDAEQNHSTIAALLGGRLNQGFGVRLFALSLLEVMNGDAVGLRPATDVCEVLIANLPQSQARRETEVPLIEQKAGHPARRLQLRDERLQEQPIDRPT